MNPNHPSHVKPHHAPRRTLQNDRGDEQLLAKGQTTGHVHIDIGNGTTIHCSITNEAIDDLALKVGDDAMAVIKASDVMVAK